MRIGNVEVASRLALAPMAGVTDMAFRQICRNAASVTPAMGASASLDPMVTPPICMTGSFRYRIDLVYHRIVRKSKGARSVSKSFWRFCIDRWKEVCYINSHRYLPVWWNW